MIIALASDHAGFELKMKIKQFLDQLGLSVEDFGTFKTDSVDYPDYGILAARAVSKGKADRGILVCGTGIGMSVVANKVKGIRAALCTTLEMAEQSRRHVNSNVLVLGGRIIDHDLALQIVAIWLKTPFEGERHLRRVVKIHQLTGC
ncbi:MAG: ribose 5-phosphate isomerase B [candidate division KSB1 bacterium]|nr:ribose 5-phosphate isomerase B [candidate division KSB1 bacterium]MDZ7333919.1 ribose 5-phosphate isomerase B [candidate division KSB1 bacterium]MDZ7358298.1 ribose 5-phosphate isomerase B [candidate division KSB1 bacterium]MDZ7399165.1 ribose 5-phosphate isomerase B [candidate division KSB1 bacterium]